MHISAAFVFALLYGSRLEKTACCIDHGSESDGECDVSVLLHIKASAARKHYHDSIATRGEREREPG